MKRTKFETNLAAEAVVALIYARVTSRHDPEAGHSNADDALERFVRSLGFHEVADAYAAVQPKHCS